MPFWSVGFLPWAGGCFFWGGGQGGGRGSLRRVRSRLGRTRRTVAAALRLEGLPLGRRTLSVHGACGVGPGLRRPGPRRSHAHHHGGGDELVHVVHRLGHALAHVPGRGERGRGRAGRSEGAPRRSSNRAGGRRRRARRRLLQRGKAAAPPPTPPPPARRCSLGLVAVAQLHGLVDAGGRAAGGLNWGGGGGVRAGVLVRRGAGGLAACARARRPAARAALRTNCRQGGRPRLWRAVRVHGPSRTARPRRARAHLGTAARKVPLPVVTSASTVGLPRESKIWRPTTLVISGAVPLSSSAACGRERGGEARVPSAGASLPCGVCIAGGGSLSPMPLWGSVLARQRLAEPPSRARNSAAMSQRRGGPGGRSAAVSGRCDCRVLNAPWDGGDRLTMKAMGSTGLAWTHAFSTASTLPCRPCLSMYSCRGQCAPEGGWSEANGGRGAAAGSVRDLGNRRRPFQAPHLDGGHFGGFCSWRKGHAGDAGAGGEGAASGGPGGRGSARLKTAAQHRYAE